MHRRINEKLTNYITAFKSDLKSFVESKKMIIHSKNLISELKTFVARAQTYEARPGCTDDLVMATTLFIRMADFIASWDDLSYQAMNTGIHVDAIDEDEAVMPMLFL